jgi:hypothetical protein
MCSRILILLPMVASFASPALGQAKKLADRPGFEDPALFTRMPNFYLSYFLDSPLLLDPSDRDGNCDLHRGPCYGPDGLLFNLLRGVPGSVALRNK